MTTKAPIKTVKQGIKTYERWFNEITKISLFTPHFEDVPTDPKCRWGQPTIFWGGSGTAKSARIKQAARSAGMDCRVILPGQRLPEDFAGVLVPNPTAVGGNSIECLLPAVRHLIEKGRGVLFIDEASNAPPSVQGAMLGLLLDRVAGDTDLPPGIRILLAANPPEIAAGGYGFDPPTANRMAHFPVLAPSYEDWKNHYLGQGSFELDPIDYEQLVRVEWQNYAPMVKGMLAGFLEFNQSIKDVQPAAGDPAGGFAWPSGRTWEMAIHAMITRRILDMPEELDDVFVDGFVGAGPSTEFAEWRRNANLPTPRVVLDGGWTHNPARLDVTAAVMASVVQHVMMSSNKEAQQADAVKLWGLFDRMVKQKVSDLIKDPSTMMVNKLGFGITGAKTTPAIQAAAGPVLNALGKKGFGEFSGTK